MSLKRKTQLNVNTLLRSFGVNEVVIGDITAVVFLVKISLSMTDNDESLTKFTSALIWKFKNLGISVNKALIRNLFAQYLTDFELDKLQEIADYLEPRVSKDAHPSSFFNFIDDNKKINIVELRNFLSTYHKLTNLDGLESFWNGSFYKQGMNELLCYITKLSSFCNIPYIAKSFKEYIKHTSLKEHKSINNYIIPLQNYDLFIDKDNPCLETIRVEVKVSSRFTTCPLNISLDSQDNFTDWCQQSLLYKPFQDYISNITNEQDCQLRLQEIAGSTFVRDNYVKKEGLIFLYGPKSTGKSGFLNLLTEVIGKENTCSINPASINQRFALQAAIGKRANFVHEAPDEKLDPQAASTFKAFVSNDPISAEEKFGDARPIRFYIRNILACNEVPSFPPDEAITYRMQIFTFTNTFKESMYSRDLEDDCNFKNAFFVFALQGALRLLKQGEFTYCKACDDAMKEYLSRINPLKEYLSQENIKNKLILQPAKDKKFNNECEVKTYTVEGAYNRFTEWANANGFFQKSDMPNSRKFKESVLKTFTDLEVTRGSFYITDGITNRRVQPPIFALKK